MRGDVVALRWSSPERLLSSRKGQIPRCLRLLFMSQINCICVNHIQSLCPTLRGGLGGIVFLNCQEVMKPGRNNYDGTKCRNRPLRETTLSAGNALRFAMLVLRAYTEILMNFTQIHGLMIPNKQSQKYPVTQPVSVQNLPRRRKGASKQKG